MGGVSEAVNAIKRSTRSAAALAVMLSVCAFAQDEKPEMVLGAEGGEYAWFEPDSVTDAGLARGAASADKVVTINAQGDNVVYSSHESIVNEGLPDRAGHGGQYVRVTATEGGFEYGVPSGGSATPLSDDVPKVESGTGAAGSGTAASREDHAHPARSVREVPSTAGAANGSVLGTDGTAAGWVASSTAAPKALGTAAAGSSRHLSRGDHVHPSTGLATAAALAAVRQVPDPAHVADGDVLAVKSGAAIWETPAGGGAASGGGEWALLASHTQASRTSTEINPTWTFATDHSATTCWTAMTGASPWQAIRMTIRGDTDEFIQANFSTGGLDLNPSTNTRFQLFSPMYFQIDMGTGSGQRVGYANISCNATTFSAVVGEFRSDQMAGFPWTMQVHYLPSFGGGGGGGGGATPLSDGAPKALGTAAPGTGTKASRGDHVHPTTGIRQLPASSGGNDKDVLQLSAGNVGWIAPGTVIFNALPNPSGHARSFLQLNAAENAVAWGVPANELPALPGDLGDSIWTLQAEKGSALAWSHDFDDALQANAASIGSNTVNLAFIDTPGGSPSEPDATDGQVWTATDCKATNNNESWTCDGDWEEPVYTRRVLLASGQTGSNSGSVDNSTFNIYSLMQNAATAFNRFEFYIEDRNNASAANYHCLMAGVRPGGTLAVTGATNTFYGTMAGISSNVRCSLNVPTTGNTTFGWDNPGGSSNKHFWVYGVRTP